MISRKVGICIACVAVAAGAFYHPVREAGFVYDDIPYVVENAAVVSPTFSNIFLETFPPGRPDTGLYRPLTTLSLIVDRILSAGGAGHALVAHAHNVVLHVIVSVLLFLFLGRIVRLAPALIAASLYATHPVLTESVAWVTGRSELLVGVWCLAGLHVVLAQSLRDIWRATALAVITALALLCKESAVVLPFIWLATACAGRDTPPVRVLGPAFLVVGLSIALRIMIAGELSPDVRTFAGVDGSMRCRIVFMSLFRYVQLTFLPFNQTVHWPPYPMQIDRLAVMAGVAVMFAAVAAAAVGVARRRAWGLGAAWLLVAILPASNLLIPIGAIMSERFLYLPLMGATVMLACGADALWGRSALRGRVIAGSVSAAIVLVAGVATFTRCGVWRDEVSLWRSGMAAYPDDLVSQVATAFYLVKRGDDDAYEDLQEWWPDILDGLPDRSAIPPRMAERIEWIQLELMRYEARRGSRSKELKEHRERLPR